MNDGTTAVQVSPVPTESEMNSFRAMLDRALNAIVQASELATVVEGLKTELNGLRAEVENVRKNNLWLDEQLTTVREQRDTAKRELDQSKSDFNRVTTDRDDLSHQLGNAHSTIESLKQQLASVQAERDEYGIKHMEVQDTLSQVNAKLAKVKESLGIVDRPEPVAAPTPQPEPVYHPPVFGDGPTSGTDTQPEPMPARPDQPYRTW